jgi:ribosomal protein S18 acetylase RimI-like enzyme
MLASDVLSIRAAGPADAPAIADVIRAAFEPYRGRLNPSPSALNETAKSIGERLTREPALAAEADGRIVGCVFMTLRESEELYVGRLAVLPGWQGRGLARRLMNSAEAIARDRGRRSMSLGVRMALTENIAFFERLGFRETGRRRHEDRPETVIVDMCKVLNGWLCPRPHAY